MDTNEINLRKKLIDEQDLVSFYAVNSQNKSLIGMKECYSRNPEVFYSDLNKYLLSNVDLLEEFDIENLINIYSNALDYNQNTTKLKDIIIKKLETENFFCEDIDTDFFMKPVHSTTIFFNKIGSENIQKIREQCLERLSKTKGTTISKVAEKLTRLNEVGNFLKYFEQGIFTQEKIELIEEIARENNNSLEFVNFGLFQDNIFNIGPDFIKYISKFPSLSAQLVILNKNNPKLLEVLSEKVHEYKNLPDNLNELEILITYFAKKCYDIKLENIDKTTIDELTNCALLESDRVIEMPYYVSSSKRYTEQEVINVEYGPDYERRLNVEYDRRYIQANDALEKKNVYLNKKFSLCIEEAKKLLDEYGSDLDNLNGLSEEEKSVFAQISEILNVEEPEKIDNLYNNLQNRYRPTDILNLKNRVAKECAITYLSNMQKTDNKIKSEIEGNEQEVIEKKQLNR